MQNVICVDEQRDAWTASSVELSAGRRRVGRALCLMAFVLGLGVTAGILRQLQPREPSHLLAAKFALFEPLKDDVDTIFLGSSRTLRHLDPEQFDALMEAAGHPTRSFNFGVQGQLLTEADWVLERILELRPRRLKWVLMDGVLDPELDGGKALSERALSWHDIPRTARALALIGDAAADRAGRAGSADHPDSRGNPGGVHASDTRQVLKAAASNVLSMFGNIVHVGGLREVWLPAWIGTESDRRAQHREALSWAAPLGFRSTDDHVAMLSGARLESALRRGARFEAAWPDFEANLSEVSAAGLPSRDPYPSEGALLDALQGQVEAVAAVPIFVIHPAFDDRVDWLRGASHAGRAAHLFDFSDPGRHGELFTRAVRADSGHLNASGARLMTRLVAQRLLELIEDELEGTRSGAQSRR